MMHASLRDLLTQVSAELLAHDLREDPFGVRVAHKSIDLVPNLKMFAPRGPPAGEVAPFVARLLAISSPQALARAQELLDELARGWRLREELIEQRRARAIERELAKADS